MEDSRKKFPSIPRNYVTLQQLQERRFREQEEQKQKEKEKEKEDEEERRLKEQKLKEEGEKENERKRQEEEERKLLEWQKNRRIRAKSSSIRFNPENHQKFSGRRYRKKEEIDSKSKNQEAEIDVAVEEENPDLKQKLEELKKTPKRKRYCKKGKIRESKTEDAVIGDLNELKSSEKDREEAIPLPSLEVKAQRGSPENTKDTNPTAEIARRIAVLSVFDDHDTVERKGDIGSNANRSTAVVNPGFQSRTRRTSTKQMAKVTRRIELPTAGDEIKRVETVGEKGVNQNSSTNPGFQSRTRRTSTKQMAKVTRRIGLPTAGDEIKRVETVGEKGVNQNSSTAGMINGDRSEYRRSSFGYRGKLRDTNQVWVKKGEIEDDSITKKPVDKLRSSGRRGVKIQSV